jgi:hypothetical protein
MSFKNLPHSLYILTIVLFFFQSSGCTDEETPQHNAPVCDAVVINFNDCIKPLLTQHCSIKGCHTSTEGGAFPLETYEQVKASALYPSFLGSLRQEDEQYAPMPYPIGSPKLSEQEIELVDRWIAEGMVENP